MNFSTQLNQLSNNNNSKKKSLFNVNSSNFNFTKLETLFMADGDKAIYTVLGVYINTKSKFGPTPMVIIDGYKVNLPKNKLKAIDAILKSPECIQAINEGHIGFQIEERQASFGHYYDINWIDL